jgi:hypothetical protein
MANTLELRSPNPKAKSLKTTIRQTLTIWRRAHLSFHGTSVITSSSIGATVPVMGRRHADAIVVRRRG